MEALEIFRMVAQEFEEIKDDEVRKWIELVKPIVSEKRFGKMYNQALALLAAHRLKMAGKGDNTTGKIDDMMRVNSYSEGDISVGYSVSQNVNASVDAEYALTAYGLQYLSIRRLVIVPIISAGEH